MVSASTCPNTQVHPNGISNDGREVTLGEARSAMVSDQTTSRYQHIRIAWNTVIIWWPEEQPTSGVLRWLC